MTRGDSSAAERVLQTRDAGIEPGSPLQFRPPGCAGMNAAAPSPALHTAGRLVTAPSTIVPLWVLYDARRRALGMIGAPGGNDANVVEANARRMVQAWNNFDAMVALLGDVATALNVPPGLAQRALHILAGAGGPQ